MEKDKSGPDTRLVIYELKEDPFHKFRIAFALMSIIPLLITFYLILVRFFDFSILIGNTGFILTSAILISLLGFVLGYSILAGLLTRLILYAVKLKESDQLKSALVANVSHEVRTPLTTVKLTLANLNDGLVGQTDKTQKTFIQRCSETIDRLIRLVNELLDLSKIEAGKFMMKRELVNLNSLIDNELANFDASLKNKGLQVEKQIPTSPIEIWADQDKITQVFINLFDNAIKHTPENGRIFVRLHSANSEVMLEMEDTGEGVPADKLAKIFDKFEREASGKTLGTGLGLPIAKDIVEMHRGRIWAESGERKGTKFTVILLKDLRTKKR